MLYPPRALISRLPAAATGTAAAAASASDHSYQAEDQPRRAAAPGPAGAGAPCPAGPLPRLPGSRPRHPPGPDDPPAPEHAREEEGQDADHLDEGIADDRPGEQHPGSDRDVPAPPSPATLSPVEQQQEDQDGNPGAHVVRATEQHDGGARRLRREDKPGREQRPDQAFRAAGTAAGDESGQEHQPRAGERG